MSETVEEEYLVDDPTLGKFIDGNLDFLSKDRLNQITIHNYTPEELPTLGVRNGMAIVTLGDQEHNGIEPGNMIIRYNNRWIVVGTKFHLHRDDSDKEGGDLTKIHQANDRHVDWIVPCALGCFQSTTSTGGTTSQVTGGIQINTGTQIDGNGNFSLPGMRLSWVHPINLYWRHYISSSSKMAYKSGMGVVDVNAADGLTTRMGIEVCDVDGTARDLRVVTCDGSTPSYMPISGEPLSNGDGTNKGYHFTYVPNEYVRLYKYDNNELLNFVEKKSNIPLSGTTIGGSAFRFGYQTKETTTKYATLSGLRIVAKTISNFY